MAPENRLPRLVASASASIAALVLFATALARLDLEPGPLWRRTASSWWPADLRQPPVPAARRRGAREARQRSGGAHAVLDDELEKGSLCWTCMKRKCAYGATCSSAWDFDDPLGAERPYCMCACCPHQCHTDRDCVKTPAPGSLPAHTQSRLLPAMGSMDVDTAFGPIPGARSVTVFEHNNRHETLVTAFLGDDVLWADAQSPARLKLLAHAAASSDPSYDVLRGPADVAAFTAADGRTYAAVACFKSNALAVLALRRPSEGPDHGGPSAKAGQAATGAAVPSIELVGVGRDGQGGFDALAGAHSVATVAIGGVPYAVVTGYLDDAIQLVDLRDPADPAPVGTFPVRSAHSVEVHEASGVFVAVVTQHEADAVEIVDISVPSQPAHLATLSDGENGCDTLAGASGLSLFASGFSLFAVIAAEYANGLQIVDLSNPREPLPVASVELGAVHFRMLDGPSSVAVATRGPCRLAVVAGYAGDGLQLIDLSDPTDPKDVDAIEHSEGALHIRGPLDVATAVTQYQAAAYVAASSDNRVQAFLIELEQACASSLPAPLGVGAFHGPHHESPHANESPEAA